MDIAKRYAQLAQELGVIDHEATMRDKRRASILAEMDVLQRLSDVIQQQGGAQPAPPAQVDATPTASAEP